MLAETLWDHPFQVAAAVVGILVAILGLVFLAGAVVGQLRRGVVTELRDSLTIANTELDIERKRTSRLEIEVRDMQSRLGILEAENRVLRETLQTGLKLAPEFGELIQESFAQHEARSTAMVERIRDELIQAQKA